LGEKVTAASDWLAPLRSRWFSTNQIARRWCHAAMVKSGAKKTFKDRFDLVFRACNFITCNFTTFLSRVL